MSGRTRWTDLRDQRLTDPTAHERYEQAGEALDAELANHARTLAELRRARKLTQEQLAKTLKVSQAQVSRVENAADLYLSTLVNFVNAIGGELELRAVFPDGQWVDVGIGELINVEQPTEPRQEATSSLASYRKTAKFEAMDVMARPRTARKTTAARATAAKSTSEKRTSTSGKSVSRKSTSGKSTSGKAASSGR